MATHHFHAKQFLPVSMEEAWDFVSSPGNLREITPPHMGFIITSGNENHKMYPGQIITYIVNPIPGIPMRWVTEITHVNEPKYFVDEQRSGPYAFWHHQHHLRSVEGGVEMEDIIHYRIPLGLIGDLLNRLFIRRQLEKIFSFRRDKLEQLFPKTE